MPYSEYKTTAKARWCNKLQVMRTSTKHDKASVNGVVLAAESDRKQLLKRWFWNLRVIPTKDKFWPPHFKGTSNAYLFLADGVEGRSVQQEVTFKKVFPQPVHTQVMPTKDTFLSSRSTGTSTAHPPLLPHGVEGSSSVGTHSEQDVFTELIQTWLMHKRHISIITFQGQ